MALRHSSVPLVCSWGEHWYVAIKYSNLYYNLQVIYWFHTSMGYTMKIKEI